MNQAASEFLRMLPFLVAAWLFVVGLYGIVTSRHLVHLIMCLVVVQTSTYLLLLGVGYKIGAAAPIFADIPVGTPAVDPVTHALMLTDIVVEATVMALLLALAIQAEERAGSVDPEQLRIMRG
ncbi:MAG TPA: NADH-quinone oxidoreductase subunit K [Candidatus Acidoferrales bacterium]|nr:NADH-quinone oxidoreductase subunit K [Candidatus Acidoferrales bacterium]